MQLGSETRLSLLEQGWALQRTGNMPAIVELLAPIPDEDLLADPELGILLGFGWFHCGRSKPALALVHALYESVRRQGNSHLHRRLQNLHAMIRLNQGALGEAEELWTDLHEKSHAAGDQLTLSWASSNLAVVADIQCRWEESLSRSQRAGAAYQRLGQLRALARCHHTMGMTYRQLGRLDEADRHFERAADYFRSNGTDDEIAYTEMERGLTLSMLGDTRLATVSVRRALERFVRLGHAAGEADSLRVLGIFAIREERLLDGRELLEAALVRIREAAGLLTEAEILEELAVLEKLEGSSGESVRRAGEAGLIYRGMGAGCRAEKMRRRLSEVVAGNDSGPGAG
jgi:tetratricopeptide (TPR) repeat protein